MSATYEQAALLYASGKSLSQVSDELGVGIGFVRKALKETGTAARDRSCGIGKKPDRSGMGGVPQISRRSFDYEEAFRLYRSGKSLSEVSSRLGANVEVVRRALERYDVERRPRGAGSGSANHQYKGGVIQRRDGYVIERGSRLKPLQHRVICENALGRALKPGEVVHHINCNKRDNRPENLLVCTHSYHMALHARMRRDPYWREVERVGRAASKSNQQTTESTT